MNSSKSFQLDHFLAGWIGGEGSYLLQIHFIILVCLTNTPPPSFVCFILKKTSTLIKRAFLHRPLGALLSLHKPESRSVVFVAEAKWKNLHAAPLPLIYAGSFRGKKERGNKDEWKVIFLKYSAQLP